MSNADRASEFDVVVAGVGSVGSAACYHLAKRGVKVLGLEQAGDIPHPGASHHGRSRMIRQAYYEHPDYVPLLRRAYQLWDELQGEAGGDPFFYRTGGLYIGPDDGCIVPGSLRAAQEHGLDHQLLGRSQIGERFPQFRPPADHVGFFEDEAGFLIPERAVQTHAGSARDRGAVLRAGEVLCRWRADGSGVEIQSERASYRARHLIITAGAWSAGLLGGLGIELEVTRQVLAWFEPQVDRQSLAPDRFPCWFVETEPPFGHYGFPVLPGDPGLKIALHKPGEAIDPAQLDARDKAPRPGEIDALRATLDRVLPGCAGEVTDACTCLYTNSADGHFVLGPHPDEPRVSFACGLSGHGFKFSSVLGEVLAEIAIEGQSSLPIGFLSPGRFR